MTGKTNLAPFKNLLAAGGLPELGPGPRKQALASAQLEPTLAALLAETDLPPENSELVRALVLLWHDRLDASHSIAQGIESPDGSFVHGIVHRREPDYGNARYWFRHVGRHDAFPQIAQAASNLLKMGGNEALAKELLPAGEWNPFAFVDLCERAAGKPPSDERVKLLREIQGTESEVLLEYFLNAGE